MGNILQYFLSEPPELEDTLISYAWNSRKTNKLLLYILKYIVPCKCLACVDPDISFKGHGLEEMFCFQGGIDPYFWLFVNSELISMNILSVGGWEDI